VLSLLGGENMKYEIHLEMERQLVETISLHLRVGLIECHSDVLKGDLLQIDLESTALIAREFPHLPNETLLVVKRKIDMPDTKDEQILVVEILHAGNFPPQTQK
jgi:hypothetical protein